MCNRHYCLLSELLITQPFPTSLRFSLPLIGCLHTPSDLLCIQGRIYNAGSLFKAAFCEIQERSDDSIVAAAQLEKMEKSSHASKYQSVLVCASTHYSDTDSFEVLVF